MPAEFIDSNVILYMFDDHDDAKRLRAEDVVADATDPCISFQVVQEVLNVSTRLPIFANDEDGLLLVLTQILVPLWRVHPSEELYSRAVSLRYRYRYTFYDSLIIAAALGGGCTRLLSEDMQHGQRIEGLTITNPFA